MEIEQNNRTGKFIHSQLFALFSLKLEIDIEIDGKVFQVQMNRLLFEKKCQREKLHKN